MSWLISISENEFYLNSCMKFSRYMLRTISFYHSRWAWVDSNHRPHAYQACALTGWAIGPCRVSIGFSFLFPLISIFCVLNVHAFTCTFKDKQYKFCLWRYFYRSTLGILTKLFAQSVLLRKEVIQPHLPIRLPCYDFTPIINPTFDCCLLIG